METIITKLIDLSITHSLSRKSFKVKTRCLYNELRYNSRLLEFVNLTDNKLFCEMPLPFKTSIYQLLISTDFDFARIEELTEGKGLVQKIDNLYIKINLIEAYYGLMAKDRKNQVLKRINIYRRLQNINNELLDIIKVLSPKI